MKLVNKMKASIVDNKLKAPIVGNKFYNNMSLYCTNTNGNHKIAKNMMNHKIYNRCSYKLGWKHKSA